MVTKVARKAANIKMPDAISKYKGMIRIAIGIILIVLIIYWVGKRAGKRAAGVVDPTTLPSDIPGMEQLTDEENNLIMQISVDLYDDMRGWRFFTGTTGEKPLLALMETSDTIFVAVYNYFNEVYAKANIKKWGTLKQWIKDDKGRRKTKESVLDRMDRLGLD
ncbi:MAG: hypothetical protein ISS18_15175 [Bacteroidales bacterium]|nr:hypothetical protein [Bacteroidales bacterium]